MSLFRKFLMHCNKHVIQSRTPSGILFISLLNMKKNSCVYKSSLCVLIWYIVVAIPIIVHAGNPDNLDQKEAFYLIVEADGKEFVLSGESEFTVTPSSMTIYMRDEDNGSCAIHLLNLQTRPAPGTYDVELRENEKLSMVCLIEDIKPRQRLASISGFLTIKSINTKMLHGQLELTMKGGVDEDEYNIHGQIQSKYMPLNISF